MLLKHIIYNSTVFCTKYLDLIFQMNVIPDVFLYGCYRLWIIRRCFSHSTVYIVVYCHCCWLRNMGAVEGPCMLLVYQLALHSLSWSVSHNSNYYCYFTVWHKTGPLPLSLNGPHSNFVTILWNLFKLWNSAVS